MNPPKLRERIGMLIWVGTMVALVLLAVIPPFDWYSDAPGATTPAPKLVQPEAVIVYVTDSGTKYHRDGCRHLRRSQHPIELSKAAEKYEPCNVCRPLR